MVTWALSYDTYVWHGTIYVFDRVVFSFSRGKNVVSREKEPSVQVRKHLSYLTWKKAVIERQWSMPRRIKRFSVAMAACRGRADFYKSPSNNNNKCVRYGIHNTRAQKADQQQHRNQINSSHETKQNGNEKELQWKPMGMRNTMNVQ